MNRIEVEVLELEIEGAKEALDQLNRHTTTTGKDEEYLYKRNGLEASIKEAEEAAEAAAAAAEAEEVEARQWAAAQNAASAAEAEAFIRGKYNPEVYQYISAKGAEAQAEAREAVLEPEPEPEYDERQHSSEAGLEDSLKVKQLLTILKEDYKLFLKGFFFRKEISQKELEALRRGALRELAIKLGINREKVDAARKEGEDSIVTIRNLILEKEKNRPEKILKYLDTLGIYLKDRNHIGKLDPISNIKNLLLEFYLPDYLVNEALKITGNDEVYAAIILTRVIRSYLFDLYASDIMDADDGRMRKLAEELCTSDIKGDWWMNELAGKLCASDIEDDERRRKLAEELCASDIEDIKDDERRRKLAEELCTSDIEDDGNFDGGNMRIVKKYRRKKKTYMKKKQN